MNIGQHILILLIRGYRVLISPVLHAVFGPWAGCRFEPTCSVYASGAIRSHGVVKGTWLAIRRLGRCHPWGGAGWDPVPPAHRCCEPGTPSEHGGTMRFPRTTVSKIGGVEAGQGASCPQNR